LVDFLANGKSQRLTFRDIPATNPGLRRGLQNAMRQASEALLALADPLRASVLFLNEPMCCDIMFGDESVRYLNRAARETFALREGQAVPSCLADVVLGDSQFWLGDLKAGIDVLARVPKKFNADPSCRILAQTNALLSLNNTDEAPGRRLENASNAIKDLADIDQSLMHENEKQRLAAVEISIRLKKIYDDLLSDDGGLTALSKPELDITSNHDSKRNYDRVLSIMDEFQRRLPPAADQHLIHQLIEILVQLPEQIMPPGFTRDRYELAKAMIALIDTYIDKDESPPRLFVAKGQLLMDMADAKFRDPSVPASFTDLEVKSRVAFQNAAATSTVSPFTEETSDLEPLIWEGDAWYSIGRTDQAKAAYRGAVVKFIEEDEPARQILWLADATARWVTVLANEGACKNSARIAEWDSVWTSLGAAEDNDLCTIVRAEQPPSAESITKLGLIAAIFPQVSELVHRCKKTLG
jgi:hypothetical protein